ncbi:MAG: NAD(P)/FAD-dependent oxidoreductase [Calditrichaeota bacterium]|nr:NAD(P)/FAD-dependent oxidoreductase [Calditrichota bacterium]
MEDVRKGSFGPLENDSVVVIVGGGPSGSGCAMAFLQEAEKRNIRLQVIIYEGKVFKKSTHHNQCAGVLSPPIVELLKSELNVEFPYELTQRNIEGYILHGNKKSIKLIEENCLSHAMHRVNFDEYLLNEARKHGAEVINARVTGIEIHNNCARIYSEGGNLKADLVVGAFGLDEGASAIFSRDVGYEQPHYLDSILTKIHPDPDFIDEFGDYIHAFLPPVKGIEFGAVTPKSDHLTINIAGSGITTNHMDHFLNMEEVRTVLPPLNQWHPESLDYYKGRFPIGIAKGYYSDRFAAVGDAAGLVRPFKGKGINAGIITGVRAAKVAMEFGISKVAFGEYARVNSDFIADLPYGKGLRFLTKKMANINLMDSLIELAEVNEDVARVLFDSVSAHKSLKEIFRYSREHGVILKIAVYLLKNNALGHLTLRAQRVAEM